jgi:hypothetical protein
MSFKALGELSIPPAALMDPSAQEVARIWIAGGGQHVSLRPDVWDDPAAWGLFLVDLAKHLARAHREISGSDERATLARIRSGFDAEWDEPTDEPKGGLH